MHPPQELWRRSAAPLPPVVRLIRLRITPARGQLDLSDLDRATTVGVETLQRLLSNLPSDRIRGLLDGAFHLQQAAAAPHHHLDLQLLIRSLNRDRHIRLQHTPRQHIMSKPHAVPSTSGDNRLRQNRGQHAHST